MLDVWLPAALKIKEAAENNDDIIEIMRLGAEKAKESMELTKEMLSKKGRSSKLGERSKGFIDPGAASSHMIINTFYESIKS